jgi:hypothetical protein
MSDLLCCGTAGALVVAVMILSIYYVFDWPQGRR